MPPQNPSPAATRSKIGEMALLTAVLLLAALLRMGYPGLTEFKADEARLITLSWQMADLQTLPLRGISSSIGLPNFPASVWLYALPLLIWPHLYAPTLFTGLLNTAAIALCYAFVRRYWGQHAALCAALMFAVSPWAIIHSRKIWAQNLLPLFVMAWAFSVTLCFVEKRPRWLIPTLALASIAFQIHLAAASLLIATAVLLLRFWRQIHPRWLLTATTIALLTAAPFLYYLTRHTNIAPSNLSGVATNWSWSANPLWHTIRLHTGWEMHALAGPITFQDYLAALPPFLLPAIHWFWGLLMLGGLTLLLHQAIQKRHTTTGLVAQIVLIWLLSATLTFVYFPTPVELHYLIPTYPTLYIAAGICFAATLRWVRWRGWAILTVSAAGQAWAFILLLAFLAQRATPGGFGTPLAHHLQATAQLHQWRNTYQAQEILIAGTGEDPLLDEFAAVYDVLLRDVPHRFVNLSRTAVFPAHNTLVLLHQTPQPLMDVYTGAAVAHTWLPLRENEGAWQIIALSSADEPPRPAIPFQPPYLLANWVNLLGYTPPTSNGTFHLHWRVGTAEPADFHFFTHAIDAIGTRIAQQDLPTFSAHQWREGDVVISRFTLQDLHLALYPLTLRTGMYRYPSLQPVPLLDIAANPYADYAEITLPIPDN